METNFDLDIKFKLILVDIQPSLCKWFKVHFEGFSDVEVINNRFEYLEQFDCMVSAGNSFGLMDGGVDAAITLFFGKELQKQVQDYILKNYEGEQPVGTSFIIPTGNLKHRYLAHTPTMRVPFSIEGTDYVYLAMKAMLGAVKRFNMSVENDKRIKSVACTGLGTFFGKMELSEASRQMSLAYKFFLNPPKEITWSFASNRQNDVKFGGFQGFLLVKKSKESIESRESVISVLNEITEKINYMEHLQQIETDESKEAALVEKWSDV